MAKDVNWTAVEADYRAGLKTLRVIGAEHGISHVRIQQRAKDGHWIRDLTERIKAKTEDKLTKAALTKSLTTAVSDEAIVEANADLQSSIVLTHRGELGVLKRTIVGLAKELGTLTNSELQDALEVVLAEKVKEVDSETRKTALY